MSFERPGGERLWPRFGVGSVLVCAGLLFGCVKHGTNSLLDAATSAENQPKLDKLRERTSKALHEWSEAAVAGAMEGWSDPKRQAAFREQTGLLAHQMAADAVGGALDGAIDQARIDQLKRQVAALLQEAMADLGKGITSSVSPAVDTAIDHASVTLAKDLEQTLGPAMAKTLHDDIIVGLADGIRKDLGPAFRDVLKDDVAKPLETEIAPSLGKVVGAAVEAPLGRILDRLEKISDKTRTETVEASRKLIWTLSIALGAVALLGGVGAWFAWRKSKAQLKTVEVIAQSIKRLEDEPGVQRLLQELHGSTIGSDAGNFLESFFAARPSLRAHRHSSRVPVAAE